MHKKMFFIEIVGVIIFFTLLIFYLEYSYKGYDTNIDRLFSHIKTRRNAQLAIVGNSHLGPVRNIEMFGLEQRDIINVSIGGQDIFHSYFLIKDLLETAKDLKYIILGIDYDMFGYSLNSTNQKYIARQYYKHSDTLEDMSMSNRLMASSNFFRTNRDISNLFSARKKQNAKSIVSQTGKTTERLENESADLQGLEFIPIATPEAQSTEFCRKRALELTSIKFSENIVSQNVERIKQIIQLVQGTDSRLIIVVTPKQECFYEYSDKKNIAIGKNSLYALMKEFAESVTFIDFTNHPSFADSLFIDPDHLNRQGVELLVSLIAEKVDSAEVK